MMIGMGMPIAHSKIERIIFLQYSHADRALNARQVQIVPVSGSSEKTAHARGTQDAVLRCISINQKEHPMDKDRIQGSVQQAKGKAKEIAGKALGDAKLEAEGKAEEAAGKIQNAVGGAKDALRGQ
jgi:uncharacterized protein YjbJ (UPF0337 family)